MENDFRLHSFMYRMREGVCADCGLEGVPVEAVTLDSGERRIVFADGSVCYSDSAETIFISRHDGSWELRPWGDLG